MDVTALFANAGTPLMWAGCFTLLFGNYLIGLFEFWLIKRRRGLLWITWNPMIPANYLSMIAGIALLYLTRPLFQPAYEQPFRYGLPLIACAWLVSFIVSVLVEWPFVAKASGLKIGKESLRTTVWVQMLSYSVLFILVFLLGSVSALSDLRQVDAQEIDAPPGWVYHMDEAKSELHRTRLDGSRTEFVAVFEPKPRGSWTRVTVEPTREGDRARLLYRDTQSVIVIDDNVGAAPVVYMENKDDAILGNLTFSTYATREFREQPSVYAGFWAREGLMIDGRRYALETPFLALGWRNPVVLPNGKVVAQFGNSIVLFDHERGKIAVLAIGEGGDVLID